MRIEWINGQPVLIDNDHQEWVNGQPFILVDATAVTTTTTTTTTLATTTTTTLATTTTTTLATTTTTPSVGPSSEARSIEAALYELITADESVTSFIVDRLYPTCLPQKASLPAVVYQQITEIEEMTTDGAIGLIETRFQFICFSDSHIACVTLTNHLRQCLADYSDVIGTVNIAHIKIEDEKDVPLLDENAEQLSRFGRFIECRISYSL